ncbi:unnamed protein product [Enterobius vermicularis]|uniref:Protein lap4 n=1 Tax=Enterobius vermicularis TaxID=51028 RepID=A0A0N4VDQ5_ENTVE|nr:unnamed protein product [Enterobius vermicularis]
MLILFSVDKDLQELKSALAKKEKKKAQASPADPDVSTEKNKVDDQVDSSVNRNANAVNADADKSQIAKKGEFSPSYENDNINNGKEPKIPSFLTEALPPPLVIGSQGTVYSDKKAENTKSLEALLKQPNLTSVSVQSTVERENDDDRQLEESDKIMEEKRQKLLNEIASDVIVETLPPLNVVGNTKHTSPNTHENLLKKGEKIENPG